MQFSCFKSLNSPQYVNYVLLLPKRQKVTSGTTAYIHLSRGTETGVLRVMKLSERN